MIIRLGSSAGYFEQATNDDCISGSSPLRRTAMDREINSPVLQHAE